MSQQFIPEVKDKIPEMLNWLKDKAMVDFPGKSRKSRRGRRDTSMADKMTRFAIFYFHKLDIESSVFRNNLAILASKLPFYDDIKSTVINNLNWLKDKVMLDFPGKSRRSRRGIRDTSENNIFFLMDKIADGDEAWIRQLFKDIRESEWDKTLISYIQMMADEMTRFVIFLFNKPDICIIVPA